VTIAKEKTGRNPLADPQRTRAYNAYRLTRFRPTRHDCLAAYTEKYKWSQFEIRMAKPMSAKNGEGHTLQKIEVLTANYPIESQSYCQQTLFK
jgi:hypothetical protein